MGSFHVVPVNEALRSLAAKVLTGDDGRCGRRRTVVTVPLMGEEASVLVGLPPNDWSSPCKVAS